MKIDISTIDNSSFRIKEGILSGQLVRLITPVDFNCKWTSETLHFRSLMLDYEYNVISCGLNKFFNLGEKEDLYPNPNKFKDLIFSSKEDGSLLVCDLIFGQLNVRTRGTFSYKDHKNISDFEYVINKYDISGLTIKYPDYSILFEIYSPNNVIVLNPYSTPEIVFLGAVSKVDNTFYPFYTPLGKEIQFICKCKIPEIFPMIGNTLEIAAKIKLWEKKEGVVLIYNNGKNMLKMKSDWYLLRHRMKSELNSIENVMDLWIAHGYPSYINFYNEVLVSFDYEIAEQSKSHISNICDAYKEVNKIVAHMEKFVLPLKALPRKDAALAIISSYGGESNNRAGFCFKLLDGKTLGGDDIKKLLFQVLK